MMPAAADALAELDPPPAPPAHPAGLPHTPVQRRMVCGSLWASAAAGAVATLWLAAHLASPGQQALYCGVGAALALAAGWAGWRSRDRAAERALTAVLLGLTALNGAVALGPGWQLPAPALPFGGFLVCLLCAAAGWRSGALLAVAAALVVAAIAQFGPAAGGLPWTAAAWQLLTIAIGLACGVFISKTLTQSIGKAREREDRFRRLLGLATDAYWELDRHYRLVAATRQAGPSPAAMERAIGSVPWELPQFGCDPETLDALLADLDARMPFRDLPARWTGIDGVTRAGLLSGEPRFDERGVFTGYWGVARDVTAVHSAHAELVATETRYQELFSHIPTPLVLHRDGHVLDANPAALALFGHAALRSMVGTDLLDAYESGDSRERARRRLDSLHGQPLGTALPVADFRLQVAGRQVPVRATSVRVDADGSPAVLAIYVDDTERVGAEEAVRRSEALLSHLVATSPDLITLTDLSTGRYAMVNHSFERMSGYAAAEAVGRSAEELGLWADPQQREQLLALLAGAGAVTDLPTQFVARSGKRVAMTVSAARFVMDRRSYMVVNARDVTERERQRLEREAILANASIGIAVTRKQRFVLANRHFEYIYGWAGGELLGQPGAVVWSSPLDYAEVGALAGPVLARGEPVELERPGRRKDGSTFLARIRGRAIDPAGRFGAGDSGTVWIVEDITERRRFEQDLARARDEAEAANRAKSAFLANTSHELRTPLNGMIGLARLARDDAVGEERRRQYLDQIAQSAQSLAAIISDILDLSKIEAGKLLIEATAFDLGAELQALQRTYATLAAAHGLALRCELDPGAAGTVLGDPLRVRQILSNFLTNAIKFTGSGWVALRAQRVGDGPLVRIAVQDSGPGLDAVTSARLFKPFTQADESTTRRFGGTGLGLSISHELATLMGGRVGVDSEPGVGSTFWVELPLPPAPASDIVRPLLHDGDAALQGVRVLMVEDNPVNMMIAVAMLERWGVEVAQAHDGREALGTVGAAAAAGRPFDAVLMDVQMPVMSGHEATRALRDAGHALPVIALTAAALVTEREAALQAGMNDFLTKPIDAEKLHAALRRWCTAAVGSPAAR